LVDKVDHVLVRIKGERWVRSVPIRHDLVDLRYQRVKTVLSLQIESNDPVGRERSIRFESPEEGDNECSGFPGILSAARQNA
jgi:hypothetical protein